MMEMTYFSILISKIYNLWVKGHSNHLDGCTDLPNTASHTLSDLVQINMLRNLGTKLEGRLQHRSKRSKWLRIYIDSLM